MRITQISRPPRPAQNATVNPTRLYKVRDFAKAYGVAVALLVLSIALWPFAGLVAWPILGVCLSRYSQRRTVWWSQADSLENVYLSKVHTIATWPISYPVFMFKVLVVEYL